MIERTFLPLLLGSMVASMVAQAQAQTPKPPVLTGGPPPGPPSGETLFSDYFEDHDLGVAETTAAWTVAKSGKTAALTIENTNPLCSDCGKYLRTFATTQEKVMYRVEYAYSDFPSNYDMISLGGGNYRASQTYWYGYLMRLDQYPAKGSRFHANQMWMNLGPNPPDPGANPQIGIEMNADGYRLSIEANDDLGGNFVTPIVTTPMIGACKQIIFKLKADTRETSEGGTGELGLWVDGVSVYSHVNKQTLQDDRAGKMSDFRIGGYLWNWLYDAEAENGMTYAGSWDNFVVMDGSGSLAAMQRAVGNCD